MRESFCIAYWLLILVPVYPGLAQQPSPVGAESPSPFLSVPSAPSDTLRFGEQLPDFEAKDINGRIWRLADFRGKLTLVDIWRTAYGSHNLEHRELQSFYEKVRRADRLQVLTFCVDYDYTHAPVYMKQRHYTFPVIADWVLSKKLFGTDGPLPNQRVIDPEGRISYPFRSWTFGRILLEIERNAAGK